MAAFYFAVAPLLFFLSVATTAPAMDPKCDPVKHLHTPPLPAPEIETRPGFVVQKDNPRKYKLFDLTPVPGSIQGFYISGELIDGALEFTIQTEFTNGDTKYRASWRAAEAFDAMMKHFEGRVQKITGVWTYGENLRRFNEAVARGASREEAAKETWTGKRAGDYKYTVVESVGTLPRTPPGPYTRVVVTFARPSP